MILFSQSNSLEKATEENVSIFINKIQLKTQLIKYFIFTNLI